MILAAGVVVVLLMLPRLRRTHDADVERGARLYLKVMSDDALAFQHQGFIDEDGDGIGEYANLAALLDPLTYAAVNQTPSLEELHLKPSATLPDVAIAVDYCFRIFVDETPTADGVNHREASCLIVAWPVDNSKGELASFLISADRTLMISRQSTALGEEHPLQLSDIVVDPSDFGTLVPNVWQPVATTPQDAAPKPVDAAVTEPKPAETVPPAPR